MSTLSLSLSPSLSDLAGLSDQLRRGLVADEERIRQQSDPFLHHHHQPSAQAAPCDLRRHAGIQLADSIRPNHFKQHRKQTLVATVPGFCHDVCSLCRESDDGGDGATDQAEDCNHKRCQKRPHHFHKQRQSVTDGPIKRRIV